MVSSRLRRSCSRAQLSASDAVFSCRLLIHAAKSSRGNSALVSAKAPASAGSALSSGEPARSLARESRSVSARVGCGVTTRIRRFATGRGFVRRLRRCGVFFGEVFFGGVFFGGVFFGFGRVFRGRAFFGRLFFWRRRAR